MPKAHKLPSGAWRCQVSRQLNGSQIRKSITADTKTEAEMLAAQWLLTVEEIETKRNVITLRKAMETYIDTCRCSGASPSTIRGYTTASKNGFVELLDKDIMYITTIDVQRIINSLSERLSPKTIKNYTGFMSVVLKQYENTKVNFIKLKLPKRRSTEMKIPSTEQVQQLLKASEKDDDLFCAILLASMLGLRLSEACALTWSKIKTVKGQRYVTIDAALVPDEGNVYHLKGSKTEAGTRTLPVPDPVWQALSKHRNSVDDRIIRCKPSAITTKFWKLADKLNVPGRFHDLRHYHASVMLSLGVPEKYICADMGHATFDMVKRVYGHVMGDKQEKINTQMNNQAKKTMKDIV